MASHWLALLSVFAVVYVAFGVVAFGLMEEATETSTSDIAREGPLTGDPSGPGPNRP